MFSLTKSLGICLLIVYLTVTAWAIGGVRPESQVLNLPILGSLTALTGIYLLIENFRKKSAQETQCTGNVNQVPILPFLSSLSFVGLAFVSTWLQSPAFFLGIREAHLWLQGLLLALAAWVFVENEIKFRFFTRWLCIIGTGMVLVAIYQKLLHPYWLPLQLKLPVFQERCSGTMGSPNHFAAFLNLLIFPCLCNFFDVTQEKKERLWGLTFLAVFLTGLLLANSRAAWASFCCGLLLFFALKRSRRFKNILILSIIAILASAFLLSQNTRLYGIRSWLSSNDWSVRKVMWNAALEIFYKSPLWGSGAGSYDIFFEAYRSEGFNTQPRWAHNDYLNVLADHGILGLALLTAPFIWILIDRGRRLTSNSLNTGLLLGICVTAVHMNFDFLLRIPLIAATLGCYLIFLLRFSVQEKKFDQPLVEHRSKFSSRDNIIDPCSCKKILIIVCFLGTVSSFFAYRLSRSDMELDTGKSYLFHVIDNPNYNKGRRFSIWEAIYCFQRSLNWDKNNLEARHQLARAFLVQANCWPRERIRHAEWALEQTQEITQKCPSMVAYYVTQGIALWTLGKKENALNLLQMCTVIGPNNYHAWYHYSWMLHQEGFRPDLALLAAQKVTALSSH